MAFAAESLSNKKKVSKQRGVYKRVLNIWIDVELGFSNLTYFPGYC